MFMSRAPTAPELNKLPPSPIRAEPALKEVTEPLAKEFTRALKAAESSTVWNTGGKPSTSFVNSLPFSPMTEMTPPKADVAALISAVVLGAETAEIALGV